jgi:hypothetical protein
MHTVKKGKVDYAHFGAAGLGLVAAEDIEVPFSLISPSSVHRSLASGHSLCCSVEAVHQLRRGYRILEALSSALSDCKPEEYVEHFAPVAQVALQRSSLTFSSCGNAGLCETASGCHISVRAMESSAVLTLHLGRHAARGV